MDFLYQIKKIKLDKLHYHCIVQEISEPNNTPPSFYITLSFLNLCNYIKNRISILMVRVCGVTSHKKTEVSKG